MRLVLALVLLLPVVGCASKAPPPEALKSDDGGVSYRYEGTDGTAADRFAMLYCANLGRQTSPAEVTREGDHRVAHYRCR